MREDPIAAATRIVEAKSLQMRLDPIVQAQYAWHRPLHLQKWWQKLRARWTMLPDAEKERWLSLCILLVYEIIGYLISRENP